MDYFQAFILALVQGLTEFLPVSSSAHLILAPVLLGWQDQGLAFDVAVHVGTLAAVLFYLRREVLRIVPAWCTGWPAMQWDEHGRLGWWIIIATIPIGLIGFFSADFIETNLRSPLVIAWATLVFGLLLAWSDRNAKTNFLTTAELTWKLAFLIGVAQAFALIPGSSRSGMTIMAGLWLGMSRVEAARFSFLLSVPTILLAGALKSWELLDQELAIDGSALLVGVVVSAITAFVCIKAFMAFVSRVGMMPFVWYRVFLAALLFAVFL